MTVHRILLAEDHTILRAGLRALLADEPGLEVVGEAADGHEAIRLASQLSPALVLMDLSMPHMDGTEAIHAIKRRNRTTKIIVLTVHKSEAHIRAALDGGADGYVLKGDKEQDLLNAIHSVLKGESFLSPGVSQQIISGYLDHTVPESPSRSWDKLTHREREIVKLIAEGHRNREIADYLSLSLKTVEKHRSNLMKKLDLHNASAITAFAIANGLTSE